MEPEVQKRLRYRRQYLLAPCEIECPFNHHTLSLGGQFTLYTHEDLVVTHFSSGKLSIVLLGDMFDYESPKKNNQEILKDLSVYGFDDFIHKTAKYSGRYIIIHLQNNQLRLLHDATATRKIFYSNSANGIWLSSQPHLLAEILDLKETSDPSKINYYNSQRFRDLYYSNIGEVTVYDEINQLRPNHYLQADPFTIVRYWPNERIDYKPFKEVAKECALMIKGIIESISNRYNLMIPVTAGKDSRTLFAASYPIRDKVFYYLNDHEVYKKNSPAIQVPKKLLSKFKVKFHFLKPGDKVDKDFERIYFENNKLANKEYLPWIYNYYVNFSDKVNLPGNIASEGIDLYRDRSATMTGERLSKLYGVSQYSFAKKEFDKWLAECSKVCNLNNIKILSLFYWEERIGNWGTQILLDKDIAQEEFNPFNSRRLVSQYLSTHPKYIEGPYFKLYKEVIRVLLPEAMKVPINPGYRKTIFVFLKSIGILGVLFRIRFSKWFF